MEIHQPKVSTEIQFYLDRFRPSELYALWRECRREASDETDAAKIAEIELAFEYLTGEHISTYAPCGEVVSFGKE